MNDRLLRADGTKKGAGYFGPVQRPDGSVSTEISIGVNLNGKETEIPLMVPSLNKGELQYLIESDPQSPDFMKNMPRSILQKAIEHAAQRIKASQSPFANDNEQVDLPGE